MDTSLWQFTPYVIPIFGAALLLTTLSVYAWWQRGRTPESWVFLILILLTAWWCYTYALELASKTAAQILFWTQMEWISIALLPVAWLLFALVYTGHLNSIGPRLLVPLLTLPAVMIALAWTTPRQSLLYINPGVSTDGPFVAFSAARGPAYFVHVAYSYALILIATVLIFRLWRRTRGRLRRPVGLVLAGALLPFAANIVYQAGLITGRPYYLDLTVLAFAFSAVLFSWGWFRLKFTDLLPELSVPSLTASTDAVDLTQSTQRRTVNLVSLGLSILLLIALVPSLTLLLRVGPAWVLIGAYLGLYLLVLAVLFWRSGPYAVRAFGLVMVYLGLMLLDLRISGLTPVLGFYVLAFVAFAAILLNGRAVAVALVTGLVGIILVGPVEGPALTRDIYSLMYLLISAAMTAGLLLISLIALRRDSRTLLLHSRQLSHELSLEREQLELRVTDRTRALEASAAVSRQLSTILDQSQLVREVVEQLRVAFAYYHVHVYLWDEAKGILRMVGGTGEAGQAMLVMGHALLPSQGLVGRAFSTNRPVIVGDVSQDPDWLANRLLPSTRAEIAVPITYGNQVLGVLDAQDSEVGGLGLSDSQLLETVAGQLAVALRNARLVAQIQQEAEQAALINSINQKIAQTTDLDGAMRVALVELARALEARDAAVRLEVSGSDATPQNGHDQ